MGILRFARSGLGFAVAGIGAWGTTGGETARAAEAASAQDIEQLQEIVVTARRREESLQDTPVAVTVFTGEMLERMQVGGTTDLDKIAPNLQFHSYGTLTGNNSAAQV